MKPSTENPFEPTMRFFTRDLYLRVNSTDDAVADRADAEWEQAVHAYQAHLGEIRSRLALPWKPFDEEFLNAGFHDAESLGPVKTMGFNEPPKWRWPASMHTLALCREGRVSLLVYGNFSPEHREITESPTPADWPFATGPQVWLYDEIDQAPQGLVHRILWSDGQITAIPFHQVTLHQQAAPVSIPERHSA